jgi:phosphoesterase RecJ-like protein
VEVPLDLLDFIHTRKAFILVGHQDPDADCLGSQLALGSALSRIGKVVFQANHGPFARVEINRYQPLFHSRIDPFFKTNDPGVIVLDCSSLDRLGEVSSDLKGLQVAVIDHHAVGDSSFGQIRWIQPKAASATAMVERLIRHLAGVPTQEEAHWLLLGLCTDTGFFRHLESGSGTVFHTAARLVEDGASPKAVFSQINGGRMLANQKLMGLVLSRTESFWGNRVLLSWEAEDDRKRLGAENRESDSIYQILSGVEGNLVVVLLRQDGPAKVTGGLRSKELVDVASLAQKFGGGGHIRASGFSCPGDLKDVKARILEELAVFFSPSSQK